MCGVVCGCLTLCAGEEGVFCAVPCRAGPHVAAAVACMNGRKETGQDRTDSTVLEQGRSCHRPTANPDLICLHYAQLISFISVIAYSHFIAVSILNFTQMFCFSKNVY